MCVKTNLNSVNSQSKYDVENQIHDMNNENNNNNDNNNNNNNNDNNNNSAHACSQTRTRNL